ncbi:MAG: hypothetical protein MRERV_1c117 [Mycoplasmataceae bacterium RV_VA103A]|nr:MAG: hypothetical protein MRERV_1c117 [Mycoplasmataceae bacterium RV_VA103A]
MNASNTSNLKDVITSTLQEILAEDPNFFFTDRLNILTWKSKKINGALITKVGQKRYLGLPRKDIKGQEYWKYKPLGNSNSESAPSESNLNRSELDPVAKFQQRQARTEQLNNYGNPVINNSTSG